MISLRSHYITCRMVWGQHWDFDSNDSQFSFVFKIIIFFNIFFVCSLLHRELVLVRTSNKTAVFQHQIVYTHFERQKSILGSMFTSILNT